MLCCVALRSMMEMDAMMDVCVVSGMKGLFHDTSRIYDGTRHIITHLQPTNNIQSDENKEENSENARQRTKKTPRTSRTKQPCSILIR